MSQVHGIELPGIRDHLHHVFGVLSLAVRRKSVLEHVLEDHLPFAQVDLGPERREEDGKNIGAQIEPLDILETEARHKLQSRGDDVIEISFMLHDGEDTKLPGTEVFRAHDAKVSFFFGVQVRWYCEMLVSFYSHWI